MTTELSLFDRICDEVRMNFPMDQNGAFNCECCMDHGVDHNDTKKRANVDFTHDEILYHCYRCKCSARFVEGHEMSDKFKYLLFKYGVEPRTIKALRFESMMEARRHGNNTETGDKVTGNFVPTFPAITWPPGMRPIRASDEAHFEYMWNRGFHYQSDYDDVWVYDPVSRTNNDDGNGADLGEAEGIVELPEHMKLRVFLPFRGKSGELVGWTGRDIRTGEDADRSKYHSRRDNGVIYGLDNLFRGTSGGTGGFTEGFDSANPGHVFVVEGQFDAKFVRGVSLCGNTCKKEIANVINESPKTKIVVMDNDPAGEKLKNIADRHGWAISFLPKEWGCKDLAEACQKFGRHYVAWSLLGNMEKNSTVTSVAMSIRKRYG